MSRPPDPHTRPALLAAARALFYAGGIAATGVDDISRKARLTKPTLYRHFPSKTSLVDAYLVERDAQIDADLRSWIARSPRHVRPQAVIDWVCDWVARPGFNGCAFLRAMAELPGNSAIAWRAKARKRALYDAIDEACQDAGVTEREELAAQLMLVVEGATTIAYVTGDAALACATARAVGEAVLRKESLHGSNA